MKRIVVGGVASLVLLAGLTAIVPAVSADTDIGTVRVSASWGYGDSPYTYAYAYALGEAGDLLPSLVIGIPIVDDDVFIDYSVDIAPTPINKGIKGEYDLKFECDGSYMIYRDNWDFYSRTDSNGQSTGVIDEDGTISRSILIPGIYSLWADAYIYAQRYVYVSGLGWGANGDPISQKTAYDDGIILVI